MKKIIRSDLVFFIITCIIMGLYSYAVYKKIFPILFPGGDGPYSLDLLREQRLHGIFSFGTSGNSLQGLGDLDFPINTWIIPAYFLPTIIYGVEDISNPKFGLLVYTILNIQLFISVVFLSINLGLNKYTSIICASLSVIIMMPIHHPMIGYPLTLFSPFVASILSTAFLFLGSCISIGKKSNLELIDYIIFWISLLYLFMSSSTNIILCFPLIILGISYLIFSKTISLRKLCVFFFIPLVIFFSIGFGPYLIGTILYTPSSFYPNELNQFQFLIAWQFVSHYFYSNTFFSIIFLLSIIGFCIHFVISKKYIFDILFLVLIILHAILGFIFVNYNIYNGPAPIYFEIFYIPIFIFYILYGTELFVITLRKKLSIIFQISNVIGVYLFYIVLIFIAYVSFINTPTILNRSSNPYPPKITKIVNILKENISLENNKIFNGRVSTFFLINDSNSVSWLDLVGIYNSYVHDYGNDLYWSGLWPYSIPTLFKYSPTISPLYFKFITFFLSHSHDKQVRNLVFVRRVNQKILSFLGVRYIISDIKLDKPFELRYTETVNPNKTLYLYENIDVNLGNISPLKIIYNSSLHNSLNILSDENFNFNETLILDSKPLFSEKLIQPNSHKFSYISGGFNLTANSDGWSSIVLPIEYSSCWIANNIGSDTGSFKILRANVIGTAVIFKGLINLNLTYLNTPFTNASCRIIDSLNFMRFSNNE